MDTATQALLGAVVGQATFSHKLGGRALLFGAAGGLIPDLDVLAVVTHGPFGEFIHHRGFTHSLWFGPVAGPILGWGIWHYYRWRGRTGPGEPGERSRLSAWMGLMILALLTHPLIDIFTTYGTQLLAPFSRHRTALNAVGIVDVKSYYIESVADIVERVQACLQHAPADRLSFAPDCGLSQTARWAAKRKLAHMVEGVHAVRDKLS